MGRALLAVAALSLLLPSARGAEPVRLAETDEEIPTYLSGPPDPNPMFFFGRQSQGAEGRIYPYPLHDNLTNRRAPKTYRMVYLENEYVRIGILPELGGRLFSAVDRTNNQDFVYRQHAIKPALIGLIGAWISGGIEWNIPHHHRASTFSPVQWRTERQADGGATVWVGELELRHRMRWAVGYTLRPGSSVLTCSVRILNRTPEVQTMLCFANIAVNASRDYQILFPPGTRWVTHHNKREFASWPVARGPYGGADFGDGTDVSWYRNHIQANSMFAWNYRDDFLAGYDHAKRSGLMTVADHHAVPGKKFWTWGSGPRGRMWDEILTDSDGPYIELMVGAYSDNQPDYSWLQPFETRAFDIHLYPFRDLGGAKNATVEAALNLEVKDGRAELALNTTARHDTATVLVTASGRTLLEEKIAIAPDRPWARTLPLPAGTEEQSLRASLLVQGRELVAYAPVRPVPEPQPVKAAQAAEPSTIANDEELFLTGQWVDQFHNPSRDADPYWNERLRRDPGDSAAHTGLGRLCLRRARYAEAETHFRQALLRLAQRHATPKDAEATYHLGLALKTQGRLDEAAEILHKATWSQPWLSPACFALAEIALQRGDDAGALRLLDRSLETNAHHLRALGLKASVLRRLGRPGEALALVGTALAATDPLDARLAAERWLAGEASARDALARTLHEHPACAEELAAEMLSAGLWSDGATLLDLALGTFGAPGDTPPMLHYYRAAFASRLGDRDAATRHLRAAAASDAPYVFPFQSEAIEVLRAAIRDNPADFRARLHLGTLLFDWQPDAAVALWEEAVSLQPALAMAWRNLAQAHAHRPGAEAQSAAVRCLEKAVEAPAPHPTHIAELDELYRAAAYPADRRLAFLERHRAACLTRDDTAVSLADLQTFFGKPDEAIAILGSRIFNVWEGGSRFSTGDAWANAHLVRGLQLLRERKFAEARTAFDTASRPPASLRAGEKRDDRARAAELAWWTARAHEEEGNADAARAAWSRLAEESGKPPAGARPAAERGRGDAVSRYHRALALDRLGEKARARELFRELTRPSQEVRANAVQEVDPNNANLAGRDAVRRRLAAAQYAAGLGHAGLGDTARARECFEAALREAPDHLGAQLALRRL